MTKHLTTLNILFCQIRRHSLFGFTLFPYVFFFVLHRNQLNIKHQFPITLHNMLFISDNIVKYENVNFVIFKLNFNPAYSIPSHHQLLTFSSLEVSKLLLILFRNSSQMHLLL